MAAARCQQWHLYQRHPFSSLNTPITVSAQVCHSKCLHCEMCHCGCTAPHSCSSLILGCHSTRESQAAPSNGTDLILAKGFNRMDSSGKDAGWTHSAHSSQSLQKLHFTSHVFRLMLHFLFTDYCTNCFKMCSLNSPIQDLQPWHHF